MADTLEIFGTEYTNVAGIIATDDNGNELTYTRGAHVTQDQDGYIVLPKTGGDGGLSDFSIAEVTLINNTGSNIDANCMVIYEEEGEGEWAEYAFGSGNSTPVTAKIVLFKGSIELDWHGTIDTISVTGAAEVDSPSVFVTGDCAITIS